MKYFNYLSKKDKENLFYREVESFTRNTDRDLLAYALGATLYMPATRATIGKDIIENKIQELTSLIICLEDAIGDSHANRGVENAIRQIRQINDALLKGHIISEEMPLVFIRVRGLEQVKSIEKILGERIGILTGFVIPKFSLGNGEEYFRQIENINKKYGLSLYLMPILETKDIIYLENRESQLLGLKTLFDKYRDLVLNIRLGGTDFSSLFGLRRNINTSLYDIGVIRDCIGSIINIFGRYEDRYVISAPVWEYFSANMNAKDWYLDKPIGGLIKESILDKENGLVGKTVIHPSQIAPVQSLQVVTYEEYMDARDILGREKSNNGVIKSIYKNKMNEVKPHLNWAKKIMKKSQIYGVYNENKSYKDLLERR